MRKIKATIIIVSLFVVLLLGGVSAAMSTHEQEIYNSITNPFTKLSYAFQKGFFFFTSWGQENGCSVDPDWTGWIRGSMSKPTSLSSSVSCSKVNSEKCAIDIWYDNTIYLGTAIGPPKNVNYNNWLKEVHGTGVSFSSTSRPYYFVEIYSCPVNPPTQDQHSTRAYVCENGAWSSKSLYDLGEYCPWDPSGEKACWCSDENDNFYVDSQGGVHCRSSSYSSVNNGVWCPIPSGNGTGSGTGDGTGSGTGGTEAVGDIRLSGEVNITGIVLVTVNSPQSQIKTFHIPLKNFGTKTETINVESGFYSASYATDVAQLYSALPFFSSVNIPQCNPAEDFVGARQVTLAPGASEIVEIKVNPYTSFVTYGPGEHNLQTDPLIWFVGLYKECLGGYTNEANTTGRDVMFDYGDYSLSCPNSLFAGELDILCNGQKYGTCDVGPLGIGSKTFTLESGKTCEITSTVEVVNGTAPGATLTSTSLGGAKKIAIDKETISKSTSADLLASSCLSSRECISPDENSTASCISITKLRDEGTLAQADVDGFFDNAKTITQGTAIGAAAGITACLIAASPVVAAFPVTAPLLLGCAAAGGLLGGSGTSIAIDLSQDDDLLDELNAGNANAVGICVKEPKQAGLEKYTGWLAWFDINGDGTKDGTDGLIIGVIGVFLLFIIFMGGGRK